MKEIVIKKTIKEITKENKKMRIEMIIEMMIEVMIEEDKSIKEMMIEMIMQMREDKEMTQVDKEILEVIKAKEMIEVGKEIITMIEVIKQIIMTEKEKTITGAKIEDHIRIMRVIGTKNQMIRTKIMRAVKDRTVLDLNQDRCLVQCPHQLRIKILLMILELI